FAPDIDAQTTGNHFVSWYSNDAWTCGPPSSVSLGAPIIVRQNDLSGNEVECTRSAMASGGVSHLHLIVRAPGAPGTFDLGVTELNTDANASEQTTAQDNQSGDDATGFLPPDGGKIRTDGQPTPGDDTNSSIRTFLGSGPGGVFKLHDGASPQDICGGQPCDGKVVEVDIPDGYNDKQ